MENVCFKVTLAKDLKRLPPDQYDITVCGSRRAPHCDPPELVDSLSIEKIEILGENKIEELKDELTMGPGIVMGYTCIPKWCGMEV